MRVFSHQTYSKSELIFARVAGHKVCSLFAIEM